MTGCTMRRGGQTEEERVSPCGATRRGREGRDELTVLLMWLSRERKDGLSETDHR